MRSSDQNPNGINITVSVKTTLLSKSKDIMMNEKADTLIDDYLFYAFVRLNAPNGIPEFWIIPSKIVAPVIKKSYEIWLKTPARNGSTHNETPMRKMYLEAYYTFPKDWIEQLKPFKGNIESLIELK